MQELDAISYRIQLSIFVQMKGEISKPEKYLKNPRCLFISNYLLKKCDLQGFTVMYTPRFFFQTKKIFKILEEQALYNY